MVDSVYRNPTASGGEYSTISVIFQGRLGDMSNDARENGKIRFGPPAGRAPTTRPAGLLQDGVRVQHFSKLLQRIVLDLPHAFLAQTDHFADLPER